MPGRRSQIASSFVATFTPGPQWSDDIKRHAGARGEWQPVWRVAEGVFAGQLACVPVGGFAPGLAWAPQSELSRVSR